MKDKYPEDLHRKTREKFLASVRETEVTYRRWKLLRNCLVYLLIILCIILSAMYILQHIH